MQFIDQLMGILSKGLIFAGSLYIVFHGVQLGFSIKDHNGPEIKQALLGVAGGAVVVTAAAVLTQVTF